RNRTEPLPRKSERFVALPGVLEQQRKLMGLSRMSLEELIIEWSKDRPAWQREVMRRVAAGETLSDKDYDWLVDVILEAKEVPTRDFGLEQLPERAAGDLPVCLLAIERPEHVNALESTQPLTLEPQGLTIVYGDNGSGKSGYARL